MINEELETEEAKENQRYEISQNSDDWKTVEFHLKSSIASEIKIDKIVSVRNTLTFNQFKSLTNSHLWSYGWYNLKGDDYDQLMKRMREHSFDIPPAGANFKVGAIFDSSNSSEVQSVYVLCKIIIGRSFCKLKQEGEKETPMELDSPYESYVYCSPEQSAKSQKMSWSMPKPYSYYIKKRNYIEPLYAVFFSHIDSVLTNMKSKFMCCQCKVREAKIYCKNCVNYYCSDCRKIHGNSDITTTGKNISKMHKEIELPFSTRPGKCSIHPDRDSEYYCEDCKRAICGYCRFKGAHSKGLQSQHGLEDIYSAFNKTKNQSQNPDFEEKKRMGYNTIRKITDQIKFIEQKMDNHRSDINKDYKDHTDTMKEKAKNAKLKVFEYIQSLREIKRNLLYFKNYFGEREKYLHETKKDPELAFVWSMHKEIIYDYLNDMEELKKEDLSKLTNELEVTKPNVIINYETYGFNKAKVQTEISNKRNTTKNDGFEQKQKEENYSIIEKTRNLILELRNIKKLKEKKVNAEMNSFDSKIVKNKDENISDEGSLANDDDTTNNNSVLERSRISVNKNK